VNVSVKLYEDPVSVIASSHVKTIIVVHTTKRLLQSGYA
jgi:hypothetical protein